METKITLVTITFENLQGLKKTIRSLENQAIHDFEQIIVDGNSCDGTIEYLKTLKVPWKVKWISEKDQGRYDAMNKGTQRAEGSFVWYLNAGDEASDPQIIADLKRTISENPNVDFIYGKIQFATEFGNIISGRESKFEDFKYYMPVSHPAILFRRTRVLESPYRTDFQMISDWILIRDFFQKYKGNSVFMNRIFAVFDVTGVSSKNLFRDYLEKLKYQKNPLLKFELSVVCGGKIVILELMKKTGVYGHYRKLRASRS